MSERTFSGGEPLPSWSADRPSGQGPASFPPPPNRPSVRARNEGPSPGAFPPAFGGAARGGGEPGGGEPGAPRHGRRRTRRGRRFHRDREADARDETPERTAGSAVAEDAGSSTPAADGHRRRRRRGTRGGRRRRRGAGATDARRDGAAVDPDLDETSEEEEGEREPSESAESLDDREGSRRRGRRRGTRGGRRRKRGTASAVEIETIPGEEDDLPELEDLPADAVLVDDEPDGGRESKRGKRRRSKKRGDETATRREAEPRTAPSEVKKRLILVNAADPEEIRVAVVEDGRIVDLQMTVKRHVSYVSDIYRGRVVNLEPAIGAAFVDFGEGRNGFLHASDVLPSYGEPDWSLEKLLSARLMVDDWEQKSVAVPDAELPDGERDDDAPRGKGERSQKRPSRPRRTRLPIEKLVKKGQMVAVQITKDAIGDKGPTLTTYISIPGRYLVLMPSLERTGVSRKIEDEKERRRLKRILTSLEIPDGMGVIVRTAGIGRTKQELTRDLDYLLLAWEDFSRRLKSGRNPAPLYQESDAAIRTMRDLFTSETEKVVVDDREVYDRMVEFTRKLMPEHIDRVKLLEGPRPLFHTHGVEQDFERIFARRVELPSGGSIVIDQTEALVAIDVNSGRTREEGAAFEDIALKTNLEAAPEIARQIRLRDLGGIIVLDYIDMMKSSSRRAVEKATREALRLDRARSKVGRISQFGLLELTRQRLGPGLSKLVYETCQRCRGSGRQRNVSSRAQAILRRLGAALALKGFTTLEVRAHPEVIAYLQNQLSGELARLEAQHGRNVVLMSVPEQVEDSVLHYLRSDGREVRPGGRRKR